MKRSNFPARFLGLIFISASAWFCATPVDLVMTQNLKTDHIRKVAILPFASADAGVEMDMTNAFSVEFLRIGCDVVDRTELDRLLKEQELSQTGLVDPAKAVEIGRLAGADAIIIGNGRGAKSDHLARAFAKIIDVKTSSIVAVGTLREGRKLTASEFASATVQPVKGRMCGRVPE